MRGIYRARQGVQRVTPNFGNFAFVKGGAKAIRPVFIGPGTGPLSWTQGVPITPIDYRHLFRGPGEFFGINVPPGVTINRQTGVLSGTPTGTGTFPMGISLAYVTADLFATTGAVTVTVAA
jgi:hypothetical protein